MAGETTVSCSVLPVLKIVRSKSVSQNYWMELKLHEIDRHKKAQGQKIQCYHHIT